MELVVAKVLVEAQKYATLGIPRHGINDSKRTHNPKVVRFISARFLDGGTHARL
jgi:hypothetical protein